MTNTFLKQNLILISGVRGRVPGSKKSRIPCKTSRFLISSLETGFRHRGTKSFNRLRLFFVSCYYGIVDPSRLASRIKSFFPEGKTPWTNLDLWGWKSDTKRKVPCCFCSFFLKVEIPGTIKTVFILDGWNGSKNSWPCCFFSTFLESLKPWTFRFFGWGWSSG